MINRETFIDAVEAAGIITTAFVLIYVVVRLDRTLTGAAREIKSALTAQSGLVQRLERMQKRLEAIEQLIWERHEILPTAKLRETLKELRDRLNQFEDRDK